MTITFNTVSTKQSAADSTSVTFAHTSDGNKLIVRVSCIGIITPPTATYNGVSMTLIKGNTYATYYWAGIFYLAEPASGTNNVVVSNGANSAGWTCDAVNYAGGGAPTNEVAVGGNTNPATINVTSASGDIVIDCLAQNSRDAITVGAGQTQQTNLATTGGSAITLGTSYEAGASTVTMSWASINNYSLVACNLPSAATASAQVIWFS